MSTYNIGTLGKNFLKTQSRHNYATSCMQHITTHGYEETQLSKITGSAYAKTLTISIYNFCCKIRSSVPIFFLLIGFRG